MEDSHNDAALPRGGESQSPREPASQKNHTTNAAAGREPPPAAGSTHPVRSPHPAQSNTGAEATQSAPNGQQERHKKRGKPGRLSPFDPFWDTEIVPRLEQDLSSEITPAGMLDQRRLHSGKEELIE